MEEFWFWAPGIRGEELSFVWELSFTNPRLECSRDSGLSSPGLCWLTLMVNSLSCLLWGLKALSMKDY